MTTEEKIINALYGGVICDGIGDIYEFLYVDQFTKEDVIEHANSDVMKYFTDDTQMEFFSAEAVFKIIKEKT